MKPPLKWIGGKTQLLPELLARVPKTFGTYYEPFVGGGALFWALAADCQMWPGHVVLSDINAELINFYTQLRDFGNPLLEELKRHSLAHSEKHYYYVRESGWEGGLESLSPIRRAARFLYINKAGFNGLWRVNQAGGCNTPWGKHKEFVPDVENLMACSAALQGVELVVQPWEAVLGETAIHYAPSQSGDFVYCDPPYVPASKTSNFTGYAKGGFGERDQRNLAWAVCCAARRGVHVLASNSEAARPLYDNPNRSGLKVEVVQARRAVNCVGSKRGKVGEILVSNRDAP